MQQKALENLMHGDKLSWNDRSNIQKLMWRLRISFCIHFYFPLIDTPYQIHPEVATDFQKHCKLKSPKDKTCLKISLEIIHKVSVKISLSTEDKFSFRKFVFAVLF